MFQTYKPIMVLRSIISEVEFELQRVESEPQRVEFDREFKNIQIFGYFCSKALPFIHSVNLENEH